MLPFVFFALLVPSQASLVSNVWDFFFDSFEGDKFENVGIGQTIECGEDSDGKPRDCLILCENTNSCANSTFKVSSANIQIICKMPSSCANVYISAWRTQSLNMTFMASKAFSNGFYIGTDNERVVTDCSFGEACKESTFYYQDAEVIHKCSSWNGDTWSSHGACRHAAIVTLRGKITLDFSNSQAFYPGYYYGYQNEEVTTYCRSDDACSSAVFHYDAKTPVKHYCMGKNACASAIIHAFTHVDVDCAGVKSYSSTYSCYSTNVISPTNNYTVTVHGLDYAPQYGNRMVLYLTSTQNMKDLVVCEDDCSRDRVWYYAANDYHFEYNCSMENDCLDDLGARLEKNPFAVYENYYWDAKCSVDQVWSEGDGDLLVIYTKFPSKRWNENTWKSDPQYVRTSLTAPKGFSGNYMVLCLDCRYVDFYLDNAEDAIIYTTKDKPAYSYWIGYSYIEGPRNEFMFLGSSSDRNLSINVTGSNEVNINNIGVYSQVYLGEVENVNISCMWSQTCIGVDIYSDINPIEEQPLSEHSAFNVECSHIQYGSSACQFNTFGLYLHFSFLNKKCQITQDGPDTDQCPFLDYHVSGSSSVSDDSKSGPELAIGLVVGGIVVVVVVAAIMLYRLKRNKIMEDGLYTNLNDDNKL